MEDVYLKNELARLIQKLFVEQVENKAFYSEASVQQKLGIELYKKYKVEPILEKKIPGEREYLDIFFELNNKKYGIELKYKTKYVNDEFEYINQSAQNNAKFDFIYDVYRLNRFVENNVINEGFSILITNDRLYWMPAKTGSKVEKFNLIQSTEIAGKYTAKWKGREKKPPFDFNNNSYEIEWFPKENEFKSIEDEQAKFNFCMVHIEN